MKKRISLGMFRDILKIFGCTFGCRYGNVIWRISSFCLTLILVLFTLFLVYGISYELIYKDWIRPATSDRVYEERHIS